MRSMSVRDTQVLVLDGEDSVGGKGGLFERFLGKLLADQFGFEQPTTRSLNVTSEGIELDVVAKHRLTSGRAIAECKAYSRPLRAADLMNFYGKLNVERFDDPAAFGIFCALPRLTPEGREKARAIEEQDSSFKYLPADDLARAMLDGGVVHEPPDLLGEVSDFAIAIAEQGVYGACMVLDPAEHTPTSVAVWAASGPVPTSVVTLLGGSAYAQGLPIVDASRLHPEKPAAGAVPEPALLASVAGSTSDFEYQFPASPKFFVGRSSAVNRLRELLGGHSGNVVVLNAQSGWGKSSLALKMGDLAERAGGLAYILDTRTAEQPRYVVEVLRRVGTQAERCGILRLPQSPTWATLEGALSTLAATTWLDYGRPIVVFFDQFENVFRDPELTRVFRNLALGARDIRGPVTIGFAWKTDLVGWTEGHPFQLRDDIRGAGAVLVVEPFGSREVDVILGRLAKKAGVKLLPDLRARLREYSQGLPWLLKKLADHLLRELENGATQEALVADALKVVGLFEADLAELSPSEHDVLRHVAKFAPIAASEVTERYGPDAVQSLVDRRLLVQVGYRLDTYWDTFRDFLNTGTVPVEESWILRQTPRSVARLLPLVVEAGGSAAVKDLVRQLETSDKAVFNLSRELRLLGVAAYESNRVRLIDEVLQSNDPEQEMRRRIGDTLRRHRAYSVLRNLAERSGGQVTLDSYSKEVPHAFPAVTVADTAWTAYARAFLFWMEYAGLLSKHGVDYRPTAEPTHTPPVRLLGARSLLRYRPSVPYIAPGRALALLSAIHQRGEIELPAAPKDREATGTLSALGAVTVTTDRLVRIAVPDLVDDAGVVRPPVLRRLLLAMPGANEGMALLEANPQAHPGEVGSTIRAAAHARWTPETTRSIGGHFRSWARAAGLPTRPPSRITRSELLDPLF